MSSITTLFILAAASICVASYSTTTLQSGNAYLKYYMWAAPTKGKIELSFKTSKPNATLVYIAGSGHHVHLSMVGGRMSCSAQLSTILIQETSSDYWNDDQWHIVQLRHKYGSMQVRVDQILQIQLKDTTTRLLETSSSPLYIGGVPLSLSSLQRFTSLEGCIRDVKVSNDSFYPFARYVSPVEQNRTETGCKGPCELNGNLCKDGESCTGNWSTGQVVCTCLTDDCKENVQRDPLLLNGVNYQCQSIVFIHEPYIAPFLSISIQPPLPANGVLFSTHEYNHQYSTVLYIQNYKPFYSIYRQNEMVTISSQMVLSPTRGYQLSVLTKGSSITLKIQDNNGTIIQHSNTLSDFVKSDRELLCIGGGAVGLKPYNGTVLAVRHNGFLISERPVTISVDACVRIGDDRLRHLTIWSLSLSKNGHIAFKVWIEQPGSVIYIKSKNYILDIQLYPGEVTLNYGSANNHSCFSRTIMMKTWTTVQIDILYNRDAIMYGLKVTVDHFECIVTDSLFVNSLEQLTNGWVSLGKPLVDNNSMFRGYIENVTSGKEATLNLEVVVNQFLEGTFDVGSSTTNTPIGPSPTHLTNRCTNTERLTPKGKAIPYSAPTKPFNKDSNHKEFLFFSFSVSGVIALFIAGALLAMSYITRMANKEQAKIADVKDKQTRKILQCSVGLNTVITKDDTQSTSSIISSV